MIGAMPSFILRDLVKGGSWMLSLEGETFLLGRSRAADLSIRDTSVSKQHCRIERRGPGYRFRDLGSRNGTLVNELRTDGGPLEDGDELRLGNFAVVFYSGAAPAAALGRTAAVAGASAPADAALDAALDEAGLAADTIVGGAIGARAEGSPARGDPGDVRDGGGGDVGEATIPAPTRWSADAVADEILERPARAGSGSPVPPPLPRAASPTAAAATPATAPDSPARLVVTPAVAPRRTEPPRDVRTTLPRATTTEASSPGLRRPAVGASIGGSRPGVSRSNVVLCCLFSVVIGLGLGILIGRRLAGDANTSTVSNDAAAARSDDPSRAGESTASAAATKRTGDAAAAVVDTVDSAASDPTLAQLVGARADLGNDETSLRAAMRIFLDVLGRSPTRAELREFLPLAHEERWRRIRELATAATTVAATNDGTTPALDTLPGVFRSFLGRLARPIEHERLLADARGNVERLGYSIVSSRFYAAAEHSRERSPRQRAHALWVDLLDEVPTAADSDLVRRALAGSPEDLQPVVRTLLHSEKAERGASPGDGADRNTWVAQTFARFLARQPTDAERQEALAELARGEDGWRRVLLDLALRRDYARY